MGFRMRLNSIVVPVLAAETITKVSERFGVFLDPCGSCCSASNAFE